MVTSVMGNEKWRTKCVCHGLVQNDMWLDVGIREYMNLPSQDDGKSKYLNVFTEFGRNCHSFKVFGNCFFREESNKRILVFSYPIANASSQESVRAIASIMVYLIANSPEKARAIGGNLLYQILLVQHPPLEHLFPSFNLLNVFWQ